MPESKVASEEGSGLNDRPLVTFALFAYNQEKYIREAVEGAFSQTYEPLEIVLSDDCSTDRTFEIMQEMAAAYTGPHDVSARRNEINIGTALHVQTVSSISKGALLVVAAGDDISVPDRCAIVADHWRSAGYPIACIHSAAWFFGDGYVGESVRPPRSRSMKDQDERFRFLTKHELPFISPTCAYSIELFRKFEPLMGGSIIEDGVMAVRSLLCSELISIDDPLVKIRVSKETSGTGYSLSNAPRWNRFILSRIISYTNEIRDCRAAFLNEDTAYALQKAYIEKIRSLSLFFITDQNKIGVRSKYKFLFNYIFFYPTSSSISHRFADALKISGLWQHAAYRFAARIYKSVVS